MLGWVGLGDEELLVAVGIAVLLGRLPGSALILHIFRDAHGTVFKFIITFQTI